MNDRCRSKDCKWKPICDAKVELLDCSMYSNKGEIPFGYAAIIPTDKQKALIPRNSEYLP